MPYFVLIRHAQVRVDPLLPAAQWPLSEDGSRAAAALCRHPAVAGISHVFSSPEPKALATATAIADRRPVVPMDALRELDRSRLPWVADPAYAATVADIFAHPGESVHGCEPAAQAQRRIVTAIDEAMSLHPDQDVVVVSHAMVLALYVAWLQGDAVADTALWRAMRLPDVAVVDVAARRLIAPFGHTSA
jgi:broad specificity phosphatase PhoE